VVIICHLLLVFVAIVSGNKLYLSTNANRKWDPRKPMRTCGSLAWQRLKHLCAVVSKAAVLHKLDDSRLGVSVSSTIVSRWLNKACC
jgi:hypothetical protein